MQKFRATVLILSAAAAVLLSGCGGGPSTGPGSTPPASSTSTGAPSSSSTSTAATTAPTVAGQTAALAIKVLPTPDGAAKETLLNCAGAEALPGSTVADPAAACAAIESYGAAAFAPATPDTTMCTMQYAGPATASITGTFHGASVNASFGQTDGCKISAWNQLAPVLGGPAGTN
ncbi:serine protease inhibitor [Arthrobacter sp. 35W]|uniref:serine protease inhibitor n=1 Tax=Arthrobacter sp. 35W TaxID=1132441 RepID=UPI0003FBD658|nr:serine protease inhibitor [Arthrobacter sp. 35W]